MPKEVNNENFSKVVRDYVKCLPVLEHLGVELAAWDGEGKPLVTENIISFNGKINCGHKSRNLGITWPSEEGSGISNQTLDSVLTGQYDSDVSGQWSGGAEIRKRTCGGNCSHESFILEASYQPENWQEPNENKYSHLCKTAFKPYDLAVNISLIIAKHHLNDEILVSSDGELNHWKDGMLICQHLLGYGLDFELEK